MDIQSCIKAYTTMSSAVFSKISHRVNLKGHIQARFDTAALERAIKDIVKEQGLDEDALLKDEDESAPHCKVLVPSLLLHCLKSLTSVKAEVPTRVRWNV